MKRAPRDCHQLHQLTDEGGPRLTPRGRLHIRRANGPQCSLVRICAPCSLRSYVRRWFFSIFRATSASRSTPFISAKAVT